MKSRFNPRYLAIPLAMAMVVALIVAALYMSKSNAPTRPIQI